MKSQNLNRNFYLHWFLAPESPLRLYQTQQKRHVGNIIVSIRCQSWTQSIPAPTSWIPVVDWQMCSYWKVQWGMLLLKIHMFIFRIETLHIFAILSLCIHSNAYQKLCKTNIFPSFPKMQIKRKNRSRPR